MAEKIFKDIILSEVKVLDLPKDGIVVIKSNEIDHNIMADIRRILSQKGFEGSIMAFANNEDDMVVFNRVIDLEKFIAKSRQEGKWK